MVYVLLADGFEEMEAVATVDILRRANIKTATVGIAAQTVRGAHGMVLQCDITMAQATSDTADMVVLPGGMPGTKHLGESAAVKSLVRQCFDGGKWVCALCAAPSVLGEMGLLRGRSATCYPGFEHMLEGASLGGRVVRDGNVITGIGAGAAVEFGLALVEALVGADTANSLRESMQCA